MYQDGTSKKMKVLIACEFSGIVRDAFAKRGHNAWSCDLLPTEIPGQHIQGDVLDILNDGWDLMIAHPPCTYLANSGVQHLHKQSNRWGLMSNARLFFMVFWKADFFYNINKICIENPVPHHYADLPKYSQIIEPYYFGDEVTKKTCLWLKGLPPLIHNKEDALFWRKTHVSKGERYIGKDGKSNSSKWYQLMSAKGREKNRSRTFQGIANAMAEQWG